MEQIKQNLIGTNPLRILAVYVGDSIVKETNHRSRISAYSKVGQTAEFSLKGDDTLPFLIRNEGMAEKAAQELSLPIEHIKFSLFWYADERFSWGRILNNAIDSLLSENLADAFCHYEYLIYSDLLRNDFIEAVTHGIFSIEKESIANILIDTISEHLENIEIILQGNLFNKARNLNTLFFERRVRNELNKLTGEYIKQHPDFYVLIDNFKSTTERITSYVDFAADLLGTTDYRYKECAEAVARSIYEQGQNVLSHIGSWVNKERTLISVKLCSSLIEEVFVFVDKSIKKLQLDDDSYKIIGTSTIGFEGEYFLQYAHAGRILKVVKRRYKYKEPIKTIIWLALVIMSIFVLNN